ncbi:MAG: hypothetical protein R2801_00230 [Chitinophagales bacterium]
MLTTTINGSCVMASYVGVNRQFCVVVCDNTLGVCDTTTVVITVTATDTLPTLPVCDTCTNTICLEYDF